MDCSSVTEGALLAYQLDAVFRNGFWVANVNKNWVTKKVNIHQPPKLFHYKLSSAVFQVCLLTQVSHWPSRGKSDSQPWDDPPIKWDTRDAECCNNTATSISPLFKTWVSLAWPTLIIITRKQKGNWRVKSLCLVSEYSCTDSTVIYRPKVCWQQPQQPPTQFQQFLPHEEVWKAGTLNHSAPLFCGEH